MSNGLDDHAFVVRVSGADGRVIGERPLVPDLEPAREWARLSALRTLELGPEALVLPCTTRPSVRALDAEDRVVGLRIAVGPPHEPVYEHHFGAPYLAVQAARSVEELLADLPEGAREGMRYVLLRRPAPQEASGSAAGRGLALTTRPTPPSLTIQPSRLDDLTPDVPLDEELPVLVPAEVLEEIKRIGDGAGDHETGGVLIGVLGRDPDRRDLFIRVTAQIPAEYTESDSTRLSFTPRSWSAVEDALRLRGDPAECMVGWWHSHPAREWCKDCSPEERRRCALANGFFSSHDRALHRAVFPRAYSVALVVNVTDFAPPTVSAFGWQQGLIESKSVHVLATPSSPPQPADTDAPH